MTGVIGWDIGGGNLKLAPLHHGPGGQGAQNPPPLRPKGRQIDSALQEALPLPPPHSLHPVTQTRRFSDAFSPRGEGVAYLVEMMRAATGGEALFYSMRSGFLDSIRAIESSEDVASANWHASAELVALAVPDGLLIDSGTTTTDIVPIKGGAAAARG